CAGPRSPVLAHGHIEAAVVMAAPDVPVGVDGLDREHRVPGRRAGIVEPDDLTHGPPSAAEKLPLADFFEFVLGSHRHGGRYGLLDSQTTPPNRRASPRRQ